MKTSSFCGLNIDVQKDSSVMLSLETPEADVVLHLDREEFLIFLVEASNKLIDAKKLAIKIKQEEELKKEQMR